MSLCFSNFPSEIIEYIIIWKTETSLIIVVARLPNHASHPVWFLWNCTRAVGREVVVYYWKYFWCKRFIPANLVWSSCHVFCPTFLMFDWMGLNILLRTLSAEQCVCVYRSFCFTTCHNEQWAYFPKPWYTQGTFLEESLINSKIMALSTGTTVSDHIHLLI